MDAKGADQDATLPGGHLVPNGLLVSRVDLAGILSGVRLVGILPGVGLVGILAGVGLVGVLWAGIGLVGVLLARIGSRGALLLDATIRADRGMAINGGRTSMTVSHPGWWGLGHRAVVLGW